VRVVIQRVSEASVTIDKKIKSKIGNGLLVLLGIEPDDQEEDIKWLVKKISNLRIFPDEQKIMNKSIIDKSLEMLVISQFTLFASTKKGNRPSYIRAARPDIAIPLYETFVKELEEMSQLIVKTGTFGADMKVACYFDGRGWRSSSAYGSNLRRTIF